jgi:hypothetical protein
MTTQQHSSTRSGDRGFTDEARQRFLKVLGMLGSSHSGERAAAALQASRMLREHKMSWSDLLGSRSAPAASPYNASDLHDSAPQWRQLAAPCRRDARKLQAWEVGFLDSLVAFRELPDGYADILCGIADKLLRRDTASGAGHDAARDTRSSHP